MTELSEFQILPFRALATVLLHTTNYSNSLKFHICHILSLISDKYHLYLLFDWVKLKFDDQNSDIIDEI